MRLTNHQGVVAKTLIKRGVLHHHSGTGRTDGMAAKRNITGGFCNSQSKARLEPLPPFINQAKGRHGNIQQLGNQPDYPVKTLLGHGIEQPGGIQTTQTSLFGVGDIR